MTRYFYLTFAIVSLWLSPALALFLGIVFTFFFSNPFPVYSKKISKYLLQASVVGLGFGINLHQSLAAGRDGLFLTFVSVSGVIITAFLLGRWLRLPKKITHLIASGTAICGGSAIAAIAPIVHADEHETSISLAVIFTLNALALFIFPPLGHFLHLSQSQFGMWIAIVIHDTSSVVGAGAAFGAEALAVATTVKLTRALWIFPLSFVSVFLFKQVGKSNPHVPWFILLFIVAMIIGTYISLPMWLLKSLAAMSHAGLSTTLFLIGSAISIAALKQVGLRPILLAVILWILIAITTFFFIFIEK